MKKIEILETAEAMLAGGVMTADQKSRYPRWLVRNVLARGYDSLIASAFEQSRTGMTKKDEFLLDNYSVTYTPSTDNPVVVQYNTERQKYYCDLPADIIVLKDNSGIRLITPLTNEAGAGVLVTSVASVIRSSLTVSQINTRFTYRLEGTKRVWFEFPIVVIEDLIMRLIPTFDALSDMDEVDEPSMMTKNGLFTIYDYVKQNLIPMPPTKQTEDNTVV